MARSGRKRKVNVKREASGRVERATPDQIRSVAIDQRCRLVSRQDASSELAGFPLGVLYIKRYIRDRRLVDAGIKWAGLVAAYSRIVGIPKATPQACQMNVNFGGEEHFEISDERISATKAEYHSSYGALSDAGRDALLVTNAVCIEDVWPSGEIEKFVGQLNAGLFALAQHYRIA